MARLAVSTLGELEVRHGDWHIRVRRSVNGTQVASAGASDAASTVPMEVTPPLAPSAPARSADIATSPAVGYFAPRAELAVGARVTQGDVLGWIDRHGRRISAVHVKDIARPGEGLDEDGWSDVGHGTMDWPRLLKALRSATPAKYYVMEQDNPNDIERFARRSIEAANRL